VAPAGTGATWVSGYYAGWFWDWQPDAATAVGAVDMTTMTHFIFGRYAPGGGTLGGAAGQLVEGAGTGHGFVEDALVAKAHAAGVKALPMLGGAGDGAGFVASTAPSLRAAFIGRILDKCVAKNYDGVDVDWEDSLDTVAQQNQLIAFLSELRSAAAARPRYQSPNAPFVITFPGYWLNTNTDRVEPWKVTVASLVEQYNLMSYGMTWNCCGWDTWLWAAIKGEGPTHPTSIEASIQAYVNAGVPRGKLGLGLGLYASGYAAPASGPRQTMTTEYFWADYEGTWAALYRAGMLSADNYHFDAAAETGYYTYSPPRPFLGNPVSMVITEDLRSIAAKGAWARAGNCGGAIVWTINYGYVDATAGNPPMQAVKQAFLPIRPAAAATRASGGSSHRYQSTPPIVS
jgi:GH18 family chitinase